MVGAAAYNLTFQVGFATTQLCEAIAIALQSLIARELGLLRASVAANGAAAAVAVDTAEARSNLCVRCSGRGLSQNQPQRLTSTNPQCKPERTHRWHLIKRGCLLGAVVSGGLSVATLLSKTSVLKSLTSDAAVQAACLSVFPMVMACQINKGACVRGCAGVCTSVRLARPNQPLLMTVQRTTHPTPPKTQKQNTRAGLPGERHHHGRARLDLLDRHHVAGQLRLHRPPPRHAAREPQQPLGGWVARRLSTVDWIN